MLLAICLGACGGSSKNRVTVAKIGVGPGTAPIRSAHGEIVPGSGLVGTWTGVVDQHGPGSRSTGLPLTVQVNRLPGPYGVGKVRYSPRCAGELRITNAGPSYLGYGFGYRLQEDFLTQCRSGGEVAVTTLGDELLWVWKRDRLDMIGALRRTGTPAPAAADVTRATKADLAGRWVGTAMQFGPGEQRSTFPVTAGFDAFEHPQKPGWTAFIRYPSERCAGPLYLQKPVGDSLRYQEILGARGGCVQGGVMDLRRFGQRLLWRWHGTFNGNAIDSWATLRHTSRDPLAAEHLAASVR